MKILKGITKSELLYYFLRGVVFIASLVMIVQRNWVDAISTAAIFVLMTVPMILKERYKTQTPIELDVALSAFVFFSLFLGSFSDYYERFPWFDGVLHFISGLLLGMVGFVLVYLLNQNKSEKIHLSPGFISFFAVSFSALISVVWEIFEFTGDAFLGFNMQESGIPDTMGDFIVNMTGSVIVAVVGYVWMKRQRKVPFTESFLEDV